MPYAPKFERALEGLAHGMKPESESLKKITPGKAKAMLTEAKGKHDGQIRAFRRMSGEEE
jgi:hypothetical protein